MVVVSKKLRNLGTTISLPSRSSKVATFLPVLATPAMLAPVLDPPAVSTQSSFLGSPAMVASFPTSTNVSSHTLSFSFNKRYSLENYFQWIRVLQVDLIYRSHRSLVPMLRRELIHY